MRVLFGITLFLAVLTVIFPQLDLIISGFFYKPGEGFFLKNLPLFRGLYDSVFIIVRLLVPGLLGLFLWSYIKKRTFFKLEKRKIVYLLLALAIGPGLLVNMVFKDHFGRARPAQITEFGGERQFTRAGVITNQCDKNCSFVAGHPSVGFFLFSFFFLYPQRKKLIATASLGYGALLGLTRIAQGGHFFSDVLFSALVTVLTAYFLHKYLFRVKHS